MVGLHTHSRQAREQGPVLRRLLLGCWAAGAGWDGRGLGVREASAEVLYFRRLRLLYGANHGAAQRRTACSPIKPRDAAGFRENGRRALGAAHLFFEGRGTLWWSGADRRASLFPPAAMAVCRRQQCRVSNYLHTMYSHAFSHGNTMRRY